MADSDKITRRDFLNGTLMASGAALLPVTLGRDFGALIEVIAGLDETAAVIANPPDSLVEGEIVHVVKTKVALHALLAATM